MRRILLITTLAVGGALLCCTSCSQRQDDALRTALSINPITLCILGVTGQPPLIWTVTGGALPDGLSLSTSSGAITGTPRKAGEFHFTVTVEDSASVPTRMTKDLSIRIRQPGGGGSSMQPPKSPTTAKGGQLWSGTMHSESTLDWHKDSSFIKCTEVWDTKLPLNVAADGTVSGTAVGNLVEQRNCTLNFWKDFPNQMTYFTSEVKGHFNQKLFELQFFERALLGPDPSRPFLSRLFLRVMQRAPPQSRAIFLLVLA